MIVGAATDFLPPVSYYRNVYLKSDHWLTLRIQRLAMSDGKCAICAHRSLSNDVHHIRYGSLYSVMARHDLRVLCRHCHNEIHRLLDENPFMKQLDEQVRWREAVVSICRDRRERMDEVVFRRSPWFSIFVHVGQLGSLPLLDQITRLVREHSRALRNFGRMNNQRLVLWLLYHQRDLGRISSRRFHDVSITVSEETSKRTFEFPEGDFGPVLLFE